MEGIDLTRIADRLAVAERVFSYPMGPHRRKHGPCGYRDYESYRDWLRDEFSYRCVFSLAREQWEGRTASFDIDHFEPRATRPDLTCDYDNLLYLAHRVNLVRGKRSLPDPCHVALGRCLHVEPAGERMGEIRALQAPGERIIRVLGLDSEDATAYRRKWLRILRAVAATDERLFRELVGYPQDLPDLAPGRRRPKENNRPGGLAESAYQLRQAGRLPDWY
jgi:hypothetical protein